jgi:hypothetical protein
MVDRVPVPQGLEQRVAKAQGDEVLDRFLAEIVVDAEGAVLAEVLGDGGVDLRRTCAQLLPIGFSTMTRLGGEVRPAAASPCTIGNVEGRRGRQVEQRAALRALQLR